jgi:hypothetical protein
MTTRTILRNLVVTCALLAGGTAAAATAVHAPGTACRPTRSDASKVSYSSTGGVHNDSTSAAKVYCPIVHEVHADPAPRRVAVVVVDDSPTADVTCTLDGYDWQGGIGVTETKRSVGASVTPQGLTFALPDEALYIIYNLTCTLPPKSANGPSRITAYTIDSHPVD